MKRFKALLCAAVMVFALLTPLSTVNAAEKSDDIVILYTNDVHCSVSEEDFGYANIAAYKKEMQKSYNYVKLVDAGDHAQGDVLGVLSKGLWIVDIMNTAGYDLATFGNHEFDYTVPALMEIVDAAEYNYISCNFKKIDEDKPVADPYKLVECGDVTIAFIGITTPETFSKSTPTYFKNDDGEYIYSFCEGNKGQDLYDEVQKNIDAVEKAGADYVVALAHLGIDPVSTPWTSTEVIENTKGLDVVIDGHSHNTVLSKEVKDAAGDTVILTQTGTKFKSTDGEEEVPVFGQLTISEEGTISTKLVSSEEAKAQDADTLQMIKDIVSENKKELEKVVGKTEFPLYISDPATGTRLIRTQETNAGDFVADAYRITTGADIGIVNGGGIRIDVPAGELTLNTLMQLHPFGNELCVKETTGQTIADSLEVSMSKMDATGAGEFGGFQHVSGIKFTADLSVTPSVQYNDKGEVTGITGDRRVKDIQVLNSKTGKYEPINLKGKYTVASTDYLLKSGGDGIVIFQKDKLLQDCIMKDYQVIFTYMEEYCDGVVPEIYKDINGQGRINIIKGKAPVAEGTTEYTVKSGDTVGRLAYTYGCTVEDILAANPEIKNNMIYAGKTIILPVSVPANSYVIAAGDTLGAIAKKNKTTVDALVALNDIKNKNLIYAGQLIVLK